MFLGKNKWLLDRIEEKDKEYYDKIFNEYKTAFLKNFKCDWTDEQIREHLKNNLEFVYGFKQDFVNELNEDDLILDNLDKFTEFFSKNVDRLLRYLYRSAIVYTAYTYAKPKLHEMGYFTNNMEAFENLKDPDLYYVYGELTDYNEDYEHRYCCESEWVDYWDTDYITENYAFYIPESSIPQEKQEWYRSHAINVR